jgi:hypothetical protein
MSYIDKLLGIAGVGSTLANISLLKRFLSGVSTVIALTALCSTMVGMILIVALYALYLALIHHGLEPQAALFTAAGMAVVVMAGLALAAVMRWRELRGMPEMLLQPAPVISKVGEIADAFITGLTTERPHPHH